MSQTLYAYRTPPQQERKAAAELRLASIRAYVPMEVRMRRAGPRHKKATVKVRTPVAPGYVFAANPKSSDDMKYVRSQIPGSILRVTFGPLYGLARIRPARIKAAFQAGDRVQIKVGPFANLEGSIAKHRGRSIYTVEVMLFGKPSYPAVHESNMQRYIDPG